MPTSRSIVLFTVLATAGAVPTQDWRLRDLAIPLASTFDRARGRLVVVGFRGETSELVGNELRQRTVPLRTPWSPVLCYDPQREVVWSVDIDSGGSAFTVTTARYDGVEWTDVQPPVRPSPRVSFGAAFDTTRGELVLFGGTNSFGSPLGDTWTFDGTTWTPRTPAIAPPARHGMALADDFARARIVLFGGDDGSALDDTWEWDGSTWAARPTGTRPSPRSGHALAFDPVRSRTVLFGGTSTWNVFPPDDTWEWDGQSWSQIVSPTTPPVGRARATAAFDPNRSEIVLAGGERPSTLLRDAWSFDGSRWQPIPLQGQRPMRSFAALAVEPSGSSVLAFSGLGISTTPAADTWRWDGRAWSQLNVPGPSPRVAAATCTSPTAVWLYGGDNWGSGSAFSDLWRWDGTAWTQVVAAGPSARTGAGMTWDLQANVAVLFGGATPLTLPTDTWTFDGVAWQQQVTTTAPTGRWSPAMAFDPVLGRTVLCGGISGASPLTDTWLWDGTAWSPVPSGSLPVGHQATTAAFDLQRLQVVARTTSTTTGYLGWSFDGQAWNQIGATPPSYEMLYATWDGKLLGYPYTFGLLHGEGMNLHSLSATAASATPYGGTCGQNAPTVAASTWPRLAEAGFEVELVRAQPSSFAVVLGAVQPASLPLLGCTLLVPPGQAAVLLPTDVRGNAALALPIPASIGFLGVALHFQAAAPDPNAPAGFAMSRGLRIGIGD